MSGLARITKQFDVCDIGLEECDNRSLHHVRVTVDGTARSLLLCDVHVAPLLPLVERKPRARGKSRVYSMAELEAMKEKGR